MEGRKKVATVGTFDGLHRGHHRVLSMVREIARSRNLQPLVITFDRHPLETIDPSRAPFLIESPSERSDALNAAGMSVLTLEFTREMSELTAEEWLSRMHRFHNVDVLVVGYDNTFGSDGRHMSVEDYRQLGKKVGVEVVDAPFEPHASSSAVRKLISNGHVEEANEILGYPFTITGTVVEGKRLGRQIGFPTANIRPSYRALTPKPGVYGVDVVLPDGRQFTGVANVGFRPTVDKGSDKLSIEVHILNLNENLYGQTLAVKFITRIRDEKKFDSLNELKARITQDILWK